MKKERLFVALVVVALTIGLCAGFDLRRGALCLQL